MFSDNKIKITDNNKQVPEWIPFYFMKVEKNENEMKCNLCHDLIKGDQKSSELLEHIKSNHSEVYSLHKDNPEANVGFRIEFLQLNDLKEDGDHKTQPIILEEVCEAPAETAEAVAKVPEPVTDKDDEVNTQYVLIDTKKTIRKKREATRDTRKRSWVWKYFDKLSSIIYRCNLCHVVLSIKGCNTNNMNRHVRSRHPQIFRKEMLEYRSKRHSSDILTLAAEGETPYAIKTEEIYASDQDIEDLINSPNLRLRRSWVWSYFERITSLQARCKLCRRNITHGGNATGNMNRHLKMIHNKTPLNDKEDKSSNTWVWKVFDMTDDDSYTCKICQYRCVRYDSEEKSVFYMLQHLKMEHGVVSGDQIITGADVEIEGH